MKHASQHVIEIILEELAEVLRVSPEAVEGFRRQVFEIVRPRWPVLFLLTGEWPPSEAAIQSFRTLAALGIEASLIQSHSFAQTWSRNVLRAQLGAVKILDDLDERQIEHLPQCFPLASVLTLSSNTMVKTVLGLRDAVPPRALRAFLEQGRPVVVAGLPPQRAAFDDSAAAFWELPSAMRQWLSDGFRTLEQWGVEFVEDERLAGAICRRLFGRQSQAVPPAQLSSTTDKSSTRIFVTADDVRAAWMRGERQIKVPRNAIVTGEAREFAQRWGILLLEA